MLNAILITLAIGAILGFILGIAAQVFHVVEDPRKEEVTKLLPGYNCGGCSYAGCAAYAEAIVNGSENSTQKCKPSKPEGREKIIAYLSETPGPDGQTITLKN